MSDEADWLAQLRQVYETDKSRRQARETAEAQREPRVTAEGLLQRCRAHDLMRQVQKTLLDGGGKLQFYQDVGGYQQAIVLMWKGPLSAAAKPDNIKDVDASIIVGADDEAVFVNDKELAEVSPEGLQQRLLEVARSFI